MLKEDHLKYKNLFEKTIAPELYLQKNTTSIEKLKEHLSDIQIENQIFKNEFDLFFLNKKLDTSKKITEIFGNNDNTKVKIKTSIEFNNELKNFDQIYQFIERNKFEEISFFETKK